MSARTGPYFTLIYRARVGAATPKAVTGQQIQAPPPHNKSERCFLTLKIILSIIVAVGQPSVLIHDHLCN